MTFFRINLTKEEIVCPCATLLTIPPLSQNYGSFYPSDQSTDRNILHQRICIEAPLESKKPPSNLAFGHPPNVTPPLRSLYKSARSPNLPHPPPFRGLFSAGSVSVLGPLPNTPFHSLKDNTHPFSSPASLAITPSLYNKDNSSLLATVMIFPTILSLALAVSTALAVPMKRAPRFPYGSQKVRGVNIGVLPNICSHATPLYAAV